MAYNNSNPDALPAHAEPEEAAQLMSGGYQTGGPHGRGQPGGYGHPGNHGAQIGNPGRGVPLPGRGGHGPGPGPGPGRGGLGPRPDSYGAPQVYGRGGYGPNPHQHPIVQNPHNPPPSHNPYASGPPPSQGYGPIPHQASRPPPTPAPPQGTDPTLYPLFKAVDKDGSGQLSEKELRAALVNGDWSAFDPHTVRMMIRMFDTDRSGTIGFSEFCGLWGFLAAWRTLFDRFDADASGNISFQEFQNALAAFGYRLSPKFVQLLFRSYDRRGQDSSPQPTRQGQNAISFDLFVQSCISLKRMTEVFKKYDDDRDGFITLSFEEFLTEILRQR